MEKEVWKYEIKIIDHQEIIIPFGAKILSFQLQHGVPYMWVLVEPIGEKIIRRFRLAGTGHIIEEGGLQYIGTIKMMDDKLIYHLFEY
ncbi:hypothetical protein LCGC14_1817010 [marine sediment metagenome]|uniref:DUF7352 domain-containing protein n=1 Tax=marine sediment metagenome TaxID=412755 RepID=A0A0F9GK26_9ZZZZ